MRRCPLCGGSDHEDAALCPAYMEEAAASGEGPITFAMDPYALFDPQTQIRMQQLAASSEQTALLTKMLALAAEQTQELKALKVEVTTLRSRALPGGAGRMKALPPARVFCAYCGGLLRQCQPTCRVHGNENT